MATSWGNQVGRWRCGVSAEIVSSTDDFATVRVQSVWQSLGWGFLVDYNSAWVSCEGQGDGVGGGVYVSSAKGETREQVCASGDFTVARGAADRYVRCAASFVMPDYQPGTSQAELSLLVPAVPCDPPAAPTGVSVARSDGYRFTLSWANGSDPQAKRPWSSVEVDARVDGGGWGGVPGFPVTLPGTAASHTFTATRADAKYELRARSVNAKGASAWASPSPVYTPPVAPANVSATFTDGSATVAFEPKSKYVTNHVVQVSADGGRTWASKGSVAAPPFVDTDPPAGTSVAYRVATVAPGGTSAWAMSSTISTYTDADYPTVSITAPASSFSVRTFRLAWEASAGSGSITGQSVDMVHGGAVVQSYRLPAAERSVMMRADGVADGDEVAVRLTVTNSNGLSTTALRELAADYLPPTAPTVTAVQDGLSAVVTASAPSTPGHCAGTVYDVWRSGAGCDPELVAEGVACGSPFEDSTAPLNVQLAYQVLVHSDGGKTSTGSATVKVASRVGSLAFDGGGSYTLPLRFEVSESAERGGEAMHFADGGESGGLPEWYGGPDLGCTWDVSGTVRASDVPALRRDMRSCGTVWLRDPMGRVVRGHPSWTLSPVGGGSHWALSATLTEVAHGLV